MGWVVSMFSIFDTADGYAALCLGGTFLSFVIPIAIGRLAIGTQK